MVRKQKATNVSVECDGPRPRKRVRNRASPVVKLYDFLSDEQKIAVTAMELDSLLDIKCHTLHDPVIDWFASLYDKHTREFVIQGRGRIPLNEDTVFSCLGLLLGIEPVPYHVDSAIQAALAPVLFPKDGSTPPTTRVFEILKDMEAYDDGFKQTFVIYIVSTILSPTTRNHVSNKCYPIMNNIVNVHKFQWCKFVADQLHDELSKGTHTQACLCLLQLLYVDSLNVTGLNLLLSAGRYAVNIWSKENIDTVLKADLQHDGKTYGKFELKPRFGLNYELFGGAQGFNKWFDTCTHPSYTNEEPPEIDEDNLERLDICIVHTDYMEQSWT